MTRQSRTLALLAFILAASVLSCIPAAAADAGTTLPHNEAEIRRAHMDLVSYTRDAEMTAVIAYIYPHYGTDTARLNMLLDSFREQEALVPAATTAEDFSNITREMRSIVSEFRNETGVQMVKGYGKPDELSTALTGAVTNNPYIAQRKAAYWTIRKAGQLEDFDAYVLSARSSLEGLGAQGYPLEKAKRALDVLASKRPELASALDARNEDRIVSAGAIILPLSVDLKDRVAEAQGEVSDAERMRFIIDQGYRAVKRADSANGELMKIFLDIGPAEPATRKLKQDLATAERILATGNLGMTKTPLTLVKKDLKDLSADYRDLATTETLPDDLGATLRALILTLDGTANQMEDY